MTRARDLGPLLDLPPAQIDVDGDKWRLQLRHTGGPAALGVVLEDARPYDPPGWVVFSDNVIDLLPGETRAIDVAWIEAPEEGRAVLVDGWNVEAMRVG
jgi:beta-mannosidase